MTSIERPIIVNDLLSEAAQRAFAGLLGEASELIWTRADESITAARDGVLQLTKDSKLASIRFALFCTLVVDTLAVRLGDKGGVLSNKAKRNYQNFAVKMQRDGDAIPYQLPHVDNYKHEGLQILPVATIVYYPEISQLLGGELVCHEHSPHEDAQALRIKPITNMAVLMHGEQLHSVDSVVAGRRLSVITNIYEDVGGART
ncbi:2OG-Fe(II) oxygenase [Pseudomonas chlororaphis]|uniref:2OG-Fe(II) oxygenase n=1 Tax=Pseudomonas chlororaphis TaxID=587753 RepID=UPI001B316E71|nr:2OG-Fe(II) oxygenase [Pseudomonas chlororaphis]QTT88297.1 2OG-Fe(II) oxygenase [Pseudomonas chlororaphis]